MNQCNGGPRTVLTYSAVHCKHLLCWFGLAAASSGESLILLSPPFGLARGLHTHMRGPMHAWHMSADVSAELWCIVNARHHLLLSAHFPIVAPALP